VGKGFEPDCDFTGVFDSRTLEEQTNNLPCAKVIVVASLAGCTKEDKTRTQQILNLNSWLISLLGYFSMLAQPGIFDRANMEACFHIPSSQFPVHGLVKISTRSLAGF